jgi:hypothetical protein
MDISENNVNVVWQDNTTRNWDVFYTQSSDNGTTFDSVVNLSHNGGNSQDVQTSASTKNVYTAWDDNTPGNKAIFFKRNR